MARSAFSLTVVNMPHFLQGIVEAQKLQVRYMRGELKRGSNRIKKHFIRDQLQGPPGITAKKLAKGKNVRTFVGGDTAKKLFAELSISRILHVHEKGMTIVPKQSGGRLVFENKEGTGLVSVTKVTIPARLKFKDQVHREAPAELRKVAEAGMRGTEVAMTKALKKSVAGL